MVEERSQNGAQRLFKQSIEQLPDDEVKVLKRMYNNDLFKEIDSDRMFETELNITASGIEQLALKNS